LVDWGIRSPQIGRRCCDSGTLFKWIVVSGSALECLIFCGFGAYLLSGLPSRSVPA